MHRVEPLSEGFTIPAVFASHHKSSHKTLQLFAAQIWEHPPVASRVFHLNSHKRTLGNNGGTAKYADLTSRPRNASFDEIQKLN